MNKLTMFFFLEYTFVCTRSYIFYPIIFGIIIISTKNNIRQTDESLCKGKGILLTSKKKKNRAPAHHKHFVRFLTSCYVCVWRIVLCLCYMHFLRENYNVISTMITIYLIFISVITFARTSRLSLNYYSKLFFFSLAALYCYKYYPIKYNVHFFSRIMYNNEYNIILTLFSILTFSLFYSY